MFPRYRDLVLEHKDALMDMAQAETGKSRASAQEEVLDIAMTSPVLRAPRAEAAAPQAGPGHAAGADQRPSSGTTRRGVVGVISPWN